MLRKQVQQQLSVVFCKWGNSMIFFFPLREAGMKLGGAGAGVMARGGVGRGEQHGTSPRQLMFILALLLLSPPGSPASPICSPVQQLALPPVTATPVEELP